MKNVFILSTYSTDSLNRRRDFHWISFSLIILKAWLHCLLASSDAFEEFDEIGIFYLCVTLLLARKLLGLLFWNFTIMSHRLFFFFFNFLQLFGHSVFGISVGLMLYILEMLIFFSIIFILISLLPFARYPLLYIPNLLLKFYHILLVVIVSDNLFSLNISNRNL